jgi:hypothetical protein
MKIVVLDNTGIGLTEVSPTTEQLPRISDDEQTDIEAVALVGVAVIAQTFRNEFPHVTRLTGKAVLLIPV